MGERRKKQKRGLQLREGHSWEKKKGWRKRPAEGDNRRKENMNRMQAGGLRGQSDPGKLLLIFSIALKKNVILKNRTLEIA